MQQKYEVIFDASQEKLLNFVKNFLIFIYNKNNKWFI
jgi:hypothetical protein